MMYKRDGGGARGKQVQMGKVLGQGAFGTTYNGTWRGAELAVKHVRISKPSEAKSFLREVATLAALRHPNILPFCGPPSAPTFSFPPCFPRFLFFFFRCFHVFLSFFSPFFPRFFFFSPFLLGEEGGGSQRYMTLCGKFDPTL